MNDYAQQHLNFIRAFLIASNQAGEDDMLNPGEFLQSIGEVESSYFLLRSFTLQFE